MTFREQTARRERRKAVRRELPADEALPCPFCGEQPIIEWWGGGPETKRNIQCECEACPVEPSTAADTEAEAVGAWNTRGGEASPR